MAARAKGNGARDGFSLLILAAGAGTRMESDTPKVLHPLCGLPMLGHLLKLVPALKPSQVGIVVGHEAERVKAAARTMAKEAGISKPVQFVLQKKPLGSGQAVVEAIPLLKRFRTVMVLYGDTPLLSHESLAALFQSHRQHKAQVTLLTAKLPNPKGYGRVVRGPLGEVLRIVEESVGTPKELAITEVNSGAYCFETSALLSGLEKLGPKGPKKEHFLTDVLELIRSSGGRIGAYVSQNPDEIGGVNNRLQLASAERVLNRRLLDGLMLSGVTVLDPASTHVDASVEIGRDTVVEPFVILRGSTNVGSGCRIGSFSFLRNVIVKDGCSVKSSHLEECQILEKTNIGPFAHIRPESVIGPGARVGNFSEVKASRVGSAAKVNHLSYIGDADIGEGVNIGAGTITCNFDGKTKNRTTVGAGAFVGSNVNLVAPVRVGKGALVAAGSTITEDVPAKVLAIARARQEIKARKN